MVDPAGSTIFDLFRQSQTRFILLISFRSNLFLQILKDHKQDGYDKYT